MAMNDQRMDEREIITDPAAFAELSAKVLTEGHALRFRAHGNSMFPFIRDGDTLTVGPAPDAAVRTGDVVFYRGAHDTLTAHRVLRRMWLHGEGVFATRGDAHAGPCEEVRASQVLGRVVCVERSHRVVRADRWAWRWAGLIWARLQPCGRLLARSAVALRDAFRREPGNRR